MKARKAETPGSFAEPNADEWLACECACARRAREAVEYGLMEAGASGTESVEDQTQARVTGYFKFNAEEVSTRNTRIANSIAAALRIYGLPLTALTAISWCAVAARDWLAEWKAHWQPVEVGNRFIVAPSWSEIENEPGRIVVRIEPGMAFGTGTHETTRLCLRAIERFFHGASFLDVGTGTGVLAIAAAKLRPHASIEACDTDAAAVEIARRNAQFNGVGERIKFRVGSIDGATASADCVCANLTAETVIQILPALISATCERLILSGLLTSQIAAVAARLGELGINSYQTETDGEWAAMIV